MRKSKDTYDVSDEELLYLAAIENTQEKVRSGREALNEEHQRFNNSQMLHQQQQAALLAAMMHHHNNP